MRRLLCVHYVELSLLEPRKWRSRLWLKIGSSWHEGSDDQEDLWTWVLSADNGEMIHRREGLLYEVCARVSHHVLLFNFEEQNYEALRLVYAKPSLDVNEMD